MKLVIVHYHLRPGGIRRVIELAAPHLVRNGFESMTLAVGEGPDQQWDANFRRQLDGTPVDLFIEPAFNYLSGQKRTPAQIRRQLRLGLGSLFTGLGNSDAVVWAHNLAVGRNLLLTRELTRECIRRGVLLISHHHDWWFDNRWIRWPEMRRFGFSTLKEVGRTIFPDSRIVRHAAINHSDAAKLKRGLSRGSVWLPNLSVRDSGPSPARVAWTRKWLDQQLDCAKRPVWIMPCRLLRRKNIAEALLLQRWLRPEACLVTTGGISSADERAYCERLDAAARANRWNLHMGVLQGNEAAKPGVAELLAASEVVLLTSIQEGFGLPYVEAAAAARPLIARSIPNISPDLHRFGFRFPQCYEEIMVAPELFDWNAEARRQMGLFRSWRRRLPGSLRRFVRPPAVVGAIDRPQPVPFSRLTLTAQLEVLAQPVERSWSACASLNPFLATWRKRAREQRLRMTPWPRTADKWLGGRAYAQRFEKLVSTPPMRTKSVDAGPSKQMAFLRERLGAKWLFPLLWDVRS